MYSRMTSPDVNLSVIYTCTEKEKRKGEGKKTKKVIGTGNNYIFLSNCGTLFLGECAL